MTAGALGLALLLQAAQTAPVLSFPDPGLDDPSAYQGYQTRFYRDSKRNAVQIYLEPRAGRIVLVWADAANESVGFTLRDPSGKPVRVTWSADSAAVADSGDTRSIEYGLRVKGVGGDQRRKRSSEALETVRMSGYEGRRPTELSGGQQQRVALARG